MAAMVWLLLDFLWAVLQFGAQRLGVILARRLDDGRLPEPGIIRLPFRPMSPAGAAILSGMICLTPVTTVLDVDMARHEMLIHLLARAAASEDGSIVEDPWQAASPAGQAGRDDGRPC